MKTIILSLGGSLICPDKVDVNFLTRFVSCVSDFVSLGNRIVIVCGGGRIAREYMNSVDESVSDEDKDWIGIAATKLNAELVRVMFGSLAFDKVISNPSEKIKTNKNVIIACGFEPGCSTDKDAVLLAKNFKAPYVINMSNVEYVYDKDPSKFKDAKKIETMSWDKMISIVGKEWKAGLNMPFDPIASTLAKKNGLSVFIIGKDLLNFKKVLDGSNFNGTVIRL